MAIFDDTLADAVRLNQNEVPVLARSAVALDAIFTAESLVGLYGQVIVEGLRIREQVQGNVLYHATLADVMFLASSMLQAQQAEIAETVGIAPTSTAQAAFQIIERLKLSEALVGGARYHLTLTQGFKLLDSVARFFGVSVLEALGLNDALLAQALASANIHDTVGIAAFLNPQLLLAVNLTDGIDITPELAVRMLFQPTLLEGVELSAGMLEPNGTFTTWTMNTRSAAVTEYQNFVFNSFAKIGRKYVGASDDGLFELDGDDDDGEPIIARMKGGFLQFGGTQLSRLKEAYIATTGEGRMILRVRTADGETYNYEVDARNGRSTKFHMGKGQRSRYFGYELLSVGQDFDLDTLEFVPIVVQRRV